MTIEDYANGKFCARSTSQQDLLQMAATKLIKNSDSQGTFIAWYGDHKVAIGRSIDAFGRIASAETGVFHPSFTFEGA